ncbi:hypothetical protein K470DRAFT_270787 [Piedraia hortae CBS 480.64]|uniref:PFU domain-containing protein n=1 Tax=Piedraia hortae CBS 480.64 TaxID=1314780 RepID=A0A6A7BYW4_9PEZI|nr:hypothetical protein K470DRAFT_270787 [Piedraia hortae CBS 480.64]
MFHIFSRDSKRQANVETLTAFEESNKSFAILVEIVNQGLPFNIKDLPGPATLKTESDQRDGELRLVRRSNGTFTLHIWSPSSSQWNTIGTIVSGEGSGS